MFHFSQLTSLGKNIFHSSLHNSNLPWCSRLISNIWLIDLLALKWCFYNAQEVKQAWQKVSMELGSSWLSSHIQKKYMENENKVKPSLGEYRRGMYTYPGYVWIELGNLKSSWTWSGVWRSYTYNNKKNTWKNEGLLLSEAEILRTNDMEKAKTGPESISVMT